MEEIKLSPYKTIVSQLLNCRQEPSIQSSVQRVLSGGVEVSIVEEILDEENLSWGRLEDGGWIQLRYTKREPIA